MSHYIFPTDFIFWTKAKNHEANKADLEKIVKNRLEETVGAQSKNWLCSVNTEFFNQDNIGKYTDLVLAEIYPALDELFAEVSTLKAPKVSTVDNIWYNHYSIGENQEVHTHFGAALSGIYFLELNETNNTVFYSYSASMSHFSEPAKKTEFIKEGDIVLFPSHLLHYVLPSTKERTTIAFNIKCEF
jgi:hypothetical protein